MNNDIERVNLSQSEILSKSPKVQSGAAGMDQQTEDSKFDMLKQSCNSHRRTFQRRRAFPVRRKSTMEMIQRPEKRLSQMSLDTFQGPDITENGIIRRIGVDKRIKSDAGVEKLLSRLSTLDTRVPIEKRELAQRWYCAHEETLADIAEEHRRRTLDNDGDMTRATHTDALLKTHSVFGNSALRNHILAFRGNISPLSLEV